MRHAKSSWKNPDLDDHRRPLNRRGKRDAPRMGRFLTDQDLIPGLIISSDAKRAITTARHVASSNGSDGTIVTSDVLYHASPSGMLEVVSSVNDDSHCLLLVVGFILVLMVCHTVGENGGLMSPVTAAWLPLLIFAPLATAVSYPIWE